MLKFSNVINFETSAIFKEAVNKAMAAAEGVQSAQLTEDWEAVANLWYQAINLMQTIPESSENHPTAQQKAVEYQKNLDYAQQNIGQ